MDISLSKAVQREQEVYKFINPYDFTRPAELESTEGITKLYNRDVDVCLTAIAQLVVLQLGAARCMISLVDSDTQYFLAGATSPVSLQSTCENVLEESIWFGCSTVTIRGGLCENTLIAETDSNEIPCFIVPDLVHSKFRDLSVVDGQVADYRFYAGTPLKTTHGVAIGSFFIMDNKPRPSGLSAEERKYLGRMAEKAMNQLRMTQTVMESEILAHMVKGLGKFINGGTKSTGAVPPHNSEGNPSEPRKAAPLPECEPTETTASSQEPGQERKGRGLETGSSEQIKSTFERAAKLMRDGLKIRNGGVVFLENTATEVGPTSDTLGTIHSGETVEWPFDSQLSTSPEIEPTSDSQQFPMAEDYTPILAIATSQPQAGGKMRPLRTHALSRMTEKYRDGKLWHYDSSGQILDNDSVSSEVAAIKKPAFPSFSRHSSGISTRHSRSEGEKLIRNFPGARQIVFVPLWHGSDVRYYGGCFVWIKDPYPVLTAQSELAYLFAFADSIMAEIGRLNAIAADRIKSDFISSISHEFRSPLHGILASTELFRDTNTNDFQSKLLQTVQSCSQTLLDTVDHVLDYAKINSFAELKTHRIKGRKSSFTGKYLQLANHLLLVLNYSATDLGAVPGLYTQTSVALLCEEVVESVISGRRYNSLLSNDSDWGNSGNSLGAVNPVPVILEIEKGDWVYTIQPGAFRRVISNIVNNSCKYTTAGSIVIHIWLENGASEDYDAIFKFTTVDTGCGMSSEYLRTKVYTAFSQENGLATGNGLGLSIVRTIVKSLNGKIKIQSTRGKGTRVTVSLPMRKMLPWNIAQKSPSMGQSNFHGAFLNAQKRLQGKSVALCKRDPNKEILSSHRKLMDVLAMYMEEWYGMHVRSFHSCDAIPDTDILVLDSLDDCPELGFPACTTPRLLICEVSDPFGYQATQLDGQKQRVVLKPVGPNSLGGALLALLEMEVPNSAEPLTPTLKTGVIKEQERAAFEIGISKQLKPAPRPNLPSALPGIPSTVSSTLSETATSITGLQKPSPSNWILIVEDNHINLKLLQTYAQNFADTKVVAVMNGQLAVDAVEESSRHFDIIFMDISMPVMDGMEATRRIRSIESGRPGQQRSLIVALTGLAAEKHRLEAEQCGVDVYLSKPASFKRIGLLLEENGIKRAST